MSALIFARMQFGISIGFHYLFPQATLGLILVILIAEWLYVAHDDGQWLAVSTFLTRILAVVFAFGVATGIILPLSFGMHWGNFSLFAAPVFGTQLAIESMVAFTLEAGFFAILAFGRSKVSKRMYLASAFFVFLGSHLSAFLIISANSWLQTPAGYAIDAAGKISLTNWLAATFNPSFLPRFFHTVTAAWLSGLFFLLAVSAWLLLAKRGAALARKLFRFAAVFSLVLACVQPLLGHQQIMSVHDNQPLKDAAYEGIFDTDDGAPLIGFGIPDSDNNRIILPLGVPKALSFLETGNPDSEVKGLKDFPRNMWPPVNVIFTTFHIMVVLAGVILAVALSAVFFTRKKAKKSLADRRVYLRLVIAAVAAPFLANELGWIGAEIGRQPWTVYGLLLTKDAGTPAQSILTAGFSLAVFVTVYVVLGFLFTKFLMSTLKTLPVENDKE